MHLLTTVCSLTQSKSEMQLERMNLQTSVWLKLSKICEGSLSNLTKNKQASKTICGSCAKNSIVSASKIEKSIVQSKTCKLPFTKLRRNILQSMRKMCVKSWLTSWCNQKPKSDNCTNLLGHWMQERTKWCSTMRVFSRCRSKMQRNKRTKRLKETLWTKCLLGTSTQLGCNFLSPDWVKASTCLEPKRYLPKS